MDHGFIFLTFYITTYYSYLMYSYDPSFSLKDIRMNNPDCPSLLLWNSLATIYQDPEFEAIIYI